MNENSFICKAFIKKNMDHLKDLFVKQNVKLN